MLYWASAIVQDESDKKPWHLAISDGMEKLEYAVEAIHFIRTNHKVLSAWIDTFDDDNIKRTIFHECYL